MWFRKDYILGMDHHLFRNVSIHYPRHNSYHLKILGCICIATLRELIKYLKRRMQITLQTLTTPIREDVLFVALRRTIPKPKLQEARNNVWILEAMWRLVDTRVSAR